MTSDDPHAQTANMLGALALTLTDRIIRAARSATDLPESSAGALVAIANHPGDTVETLRRLLSLTHSGAVRLIDGLAAAGLVERRRSERDARAVTVWVTEDGRRQAAAIIAARRRVLADLARSLVPAQADQLSDLLRVLLAAVTAGVDDARATCRFCEEGVCRPNGCPVEQAAIGA